jgi:elongation factor P
MIDAGELKKGVAIELDGQLYQVIDLQHIKMGRGSAQIRLKLRDIRAGHTTERSFQASEKFKMAPLERRHVQYLYNDGDNYYFMDQETFDQPGISKDTLGDSVNFLQEGMSCKLTFYKGEPLDIELPLTVDLKVIYAEVAVRGDTATGVTKKVKVETGAEVQCPNFVKEGDTIRVDTRDGSYVTRV